MSCWKVLALTLHSWLYCLFFLWLAVVLLWASLCKFGSNAEKAVVRRLGIHLLLGQLFAVTLIIPFVFHNIQWQIHPSVAAIEAWAVPWHFFAVDSFREIGLFIAVFGVVKIGDATWVELGFKRPGISAPWLLSAIAMAYILLRYIIAPVSMDIWHWIPVLFGGHLAQDIYPIDGIQLDAWIFVGIANQQGWVFLFIVCWTVLFGPIIEEIFFRGLVLTTLLKRTSTSVALVIQAILFAAMHVDLARFPYLIIFGLILGLLAKWTSSLLPSVLLHVIINCFAIMAALTYGVQ